MLESIVLAASYPLRLMATWLSVGCLRLFGVDVEADRTLITLGGEGVRIAVTDACSGMEQLLGLVLVGGVFAFMMQRSLPLKLMHWATILLCVVLANAVRLIATVVLVRNVGEAVLGDTWHMALGWAQTVLAVALLWLFGKCISHASSSDAKKEAD
ncbi:MAG: exosortase/archaeosortase family protein [Kiritimatiellae bacterium]|nr:exosortase/archaeosortase family protein [Kiritimatiellia bacterium]